MKKILIATHGNFASGVKSTLLFILGDVVDITCIDAYINPDENLVETLDTYFGNLEPEDELIIMTDIKGGSVNQKIVPYAAKRDALLLTGFNLPLLVAIAIAPEGMTKEEAKKIIKEAKDQMELVELTMDGNDDDNFFS